MTTTISFADATDGHVTSHSASYASAKAGAGLSATTGLGTAIWGLALGGAIPGEYSLDEVFLSFTYSTPTELVVGAYIETHVFNALSPAVTRTFRWLEYEWGASLTTADFRTQTQLAALTTLAEIGPSVEDAPAGQAIFGGSDALSTRVASAGPLRVVGVSDREQAGTTPTVDERATIYSADASGTANDPRLIIETAPLSTATGTMSAQVQLSDGTHAYLEYDAFTPMRIRHRNAAGTVVTVGSIGLGFGLTDFLSTWTTAQAFALAVDASDNLYVLGTSAGARTSIVVEPWLKGVGHTWTVGTRRETTLGAFSGGAVNNVAAAWHSVGGASGTIVVVAGHSTGRVPQLTLDVRYALLNVDYLLTGVGSLLRGSGAAQGTLIESSSGVAWATAANETGTMLDVVAAPGTSDRGYVFSASGRVGLGGAAYASAYRYVLNAGGTGFTATHGVATAYATKDATAKLRVVALSATVFALISCDPDTGYGPTAVVLQNVGTSPSFTILANVTMSDEGIASLPSEAFFATSPLWDVAYDTVGNRLWLYYFDTANSRRLMRTSVNMTTYLAVRDEVQISSTVGAVGSTNHGIRVHRGAMNGQKVLVSVANRDSGGVLSTLYLEDSFNVAPTAPTLTTRANFDATATALFGWTFNDPNAGDTQSAYELDINTSVGADVYDTGKIASATAALVAVGAAATANNASVSPALPAGTADGDTLLMLASIRSSGAGTVVAPLGWKALATSGNVALLGKIASSGEVAPTVTFTGGSAGDDTIAQIAGFRNLPLSVFASAAQLNASAQNVAFPALTVPLNNGLVLVIGWKQDDSTGYAALAGMTELGEANPTAGNDASQAWDYVLQGAAANVAASSLVVTGGASAISRGLTVAIGPAGLTPTASIHTLPANVLTNPGSYQWRVRTWDAAGLAGPWSGYSTFQTAAGGTVTVIDPVADNPAGVITDDYLVQWSVAGTTQASYRVKLYRTDTGALVSDTGWVASVATSLLVGGMVSDVEHRVEVTVRTAGLVESGTGTRLITPSYGSPEVPTAVVTEVPEAGYIEIVVTNPVVVSPPNDRPAVAVNQIRRAVAGTDDWITVGNAPPNGTYRDYSVASGVEYTYVVRGVSA